MTHQGKTTIQTQEIISTPAAYVARSGRQARDIQPHVSLLIVQPTPFCNINCSYCYLASRSNRAVVEDRTLHALFQQLFASGWVGQQLDLAWHAGSRRCCRCRSTSTRSRSWSSTVRPG